MTHWTTVSDSEKVDADKLKQAGAKAVVKTGACSVQVVIGLKVQKVADELRKLMERRKGPLR